jgi:two-component system sensor histidine kinase BaeS
MCSITFGVQAGDAALFLLCTIMGMVFGAFAARGIWGVSSMRRKRLHADFAHELQTPIAILRGNLEIIEHSAPAELSHSLRVMHTTLDGLARFTATSLAGMAAKSFGRDIRHVPIPVRAFLDEICEDCFVLGEYNDVKISAMSEDVAVVGDRDTLKEVLFNLVGNALKHTPPGGAIALSARQNEHMVEIAVVDTGSGIAPEFLPHIFERFYRNDGDGSPGNGIGLYLCRQIIEAHRGTITAESESGRGSRFVITIPIYLL